MIGASQTEQGVIVCRHPPATHVRRLRAVVNQGTREEPKYLEVGAAWPHKRGFTLRLKDQAGNVTQIILFNVSSNATVVAGGAA